MPKVLIDIPISKGREISIIKGTHADFPNKLLFSCSEYTERDKNGDKIPIEKGAVNKVLGGPLTWEDYQKIADALLDQSIVGFKIASTSKQYLDELMAGKKVSEMGVRDCA